MKIMRVGVDLAKTFFIFTVLTEMSSQYGAGGCLGGNGSRR